MSADATPPLPAPADREVKLQRITYLRGPNIWTYRSAIEAWVALGPLEAYPSAAIPGFNERLLALLPALAEHHCGVGEKGGFGQRLTQGTWLGHVLEHVVIELLNLAGMPTGFGQTRSTSQPGVYRMVFRARDENVGRTALAQGHALLQAALQERPGFDVEAAVDAVREAIDDSYLGPSTVAIVAAATERGIPHIRLNEGNLVQLGYGAKQKRIWTAETERTGAIAEGIAGDKDLTKSLLQACGVPVPEGAAVKSADAAWTAAQDIGLPVVVKPSDGNHGRGVTLDLSDEAGVRAAFEVAARHGSEVLVERCIHGLEHRLLVVGGRVVAAARGELAWVTGDGRLSIADLVDAQINSDPRRGTTEAHPLNRLNIREDGVILVDLQRQGLTPDSVLPAGEKLLVQRNGNVAMDCTDEVHPEVAEQVALAARVVGLDIAGVDLVAQDIARPLEEQGGAIVEVNAGPGLLMHLKPASGQPQPVGQAIVEHLFPSEGADAHDGRIPIVGIYGANKAVAMAARIVTWLLHVAGQRVALACREGGFIGPRLIDKLPPTAALNMQALWACGHRLLMNREATAAVLECTPALILDQGLPFDRCQVGVVMDFEGHEQLAHHDIEGSDAMRKVARTVIDVVQGAGVGVLNADDPRIADLAELCDGQILFYASVAEGGAPSEALQAHMVAGGRAVWLRSGQAHLQEGSRSDTVIDLAQAGRLHGRADDPAHARAMLAAVAVAWGFGLAPELIQAGLTTFKPQG